MELKEIGNLELFDMLTRLNKSIANAAALGIDVSAFRSARNDVDDEIFTRFSTVIHMSSGTASVLRARCRATA